MPTPASKIWSVVEVCDIRDEADHSNNQTSDEGNPISQSSALQLSVQQSEQNKRSPESSLSSLSKSPSTSATKSPLRSPSALTDGNPISKSSALQPSVKQSEQNKCSSESSLSSLSKSPSTSTDRIPMNKSSVLRPSVQQSKQNKRLFESSSSSLSTSTDGIPRNKSSVLQPSVQQSKQNKRLLESSSSSPSKSPSTSPSTSPSKLPSTSLTHSLSVVHQRLIHNTLPFYAAFPGEYRYLIKPADFLENASLWRLLWCYGIKSLSEPQNLAMGKNFLLEIENLINLEWHCTDGTAYADDFQIITSDGKTWKEPEIQEYAKTFTRPTQKKQFSVCSFDQCFRCVFAERPISDSIVQQHVIFRLGALYRCVPCGLVTCLKGSLLIHTEVCPFKSRVGYENPDIQKKNKPPRKKLKVYQSKITRTKDGNYVTRFADWTKDLLENIKKDGYLPDKSVQELFDEIKKDIDYNFVEFFKYVNKTIIITKQFPVKLDDDEYYTIIYYSPTSTENTDPSKSAMFQILEMAFNKTVSIHRLVKVIDQTLTKEDNKCHYTWCDCNGTYVNSDKVELAGHVISQNFLIVCVGCKTGFIYFEYYQKHLKQECFITRKTKTDPI